MDKEMIVMALRCRKSGGDNNHLCAQCRYKYAIYCDIYELFGDAADLIEAQAAEIERLTAREQTNTQNGDLSKGMARGKRYPLLLSWLQESSKKRRGVLP